MFRRNSSMLINRLSSLFGCLALTGTCFAEVLFEGKVSPADIDFTLAEGFTFEEVAEVPKKLGSWVSLAILPAKEGQVHLAAGDQYGAIYDVVISEKNEVTVSPLDIDLKGAHGLLYFEDSLYVVVGESVGPKEGPKPREKGLYRAQDKDGNGSFESIEPLKTFKAGGEHGIHSLVSSPDGEWLYLVIGNYTQNTNLERSLVSKHWDEDQLLPRNPDGRGHARGLMAPAGRVLRCRPDGSDWEYVSVGYRNPFDGAFGEDGSFFVYDADMEWDMGMPWYRPTRLCFAMPGSEFGWRHGTGKWPSYYEDSLPSVVDFGPGSPVGVVSGRGAKFPEAYQKKIYCFDWTFATIYAVTVEDDGFGYKGEWEEFLTAKALPLTDATIAQDGSLYFASGGRRQGSKLWRVKYGGEEDTKDAWTERPRLAREDFKGDDRYSRFHDRNKAEMEGPEALRSLLGKGSVLQRLTVVMGLARVGEKSDRKALTDELLGLDWTAMSEHEKVNWLRAAGLVFIRLGEPEEEVREAVLAKIDSSFPTEERIVETELCRMLCYLQAPKIVDRILALLAEPEEKEMPEWGRLLARSQGNYGAKAAEVIRELGSPRKVHLAYCLRVVKGPWTEGQRRQLMNWYTQEMNGKAQKSAQLGIEKMRNDTLKNATKEERKMIESWGLEVEKRPYDQERPVAKGPARAWTVEQIVEVAQDLKKADVENGAKMYHAALCIDCHRFGAVGGAAGPDLTNVAGRFTAEELAVAILDPSREISNQYEFKTFIKVDGSTERGRVVDERDEILVIATNPFDFSQTIEISRADIKEIKPSLVSPMPPAMVTMFGEEEMRDFLAYLLGVD